MIKVTGSTTITTDREVLDNIGDYIMGVVGSQDWIEHIDNIASYVAAGIGWYESEVIGYLEARLGK